jgi:hypothetical protein
MLIYVYQNNVGAEVGAIINMSALAVSQLLESAQERGIELSLETAAIENQVSVTNLNHFQLFFVPGYFYCRYCPEYELFSITELLSTQFSL